MMISFLFVVFCTMVLTQRVKLKSLHYIHIPKCGTSFLIVLRNYLDACKVKNFSCNAFSGGWSANGTEKQPFFASRVLSMEQETCSGHLIGCQSNIYHAQMQLPFVSHNLITMLREPTARLVSNLEMRGVTNASSVVEVIDATAKNKKPFINIQAAFISGRSVNISGLAAIESLNHNFVFYGLTDYWGLSICLFHCELGGEFSSVECTNVRPRLNDPLTIKDTSILKTYTEQDDILYAYAKVRFFERVKRCNCIDLCATKENWRR